jgi:hypothetical protein
MSLGLNDTFPFGKHRDKVIAQVMSTKSGVEYCCWLRAKRIKENADYAFFDAETNSAIDIDRDRAVVRETYREGKHPARDAIKPAATEVAYGDAWGAW